MEKRNWIIGIGGSDYDDVLMYRVRGTYDDVKKYLWDMILSDREYKTDFDFGTESINDIRCLDDCYMYGFNCFENYHNDFVARLEYEIEIIEL